MHHWLGAGYSERVDIPSPSFLTGAPRTCHRGGTVTFPAGAQAVPPEKKM